MDENLKKCSSCKKIIDLSCFHNYKNGVKGKHHSCKSCRKKNEPSRKEYLKIWRKNNKELKYRIDKEYRIKNKHKITLYKKSDKYKEIKSKSDKKYYQKCMENPSVKMAMRIRSMISSYSKFKKNKTFEILGYNSSDLVLHLESRFKDGMSWDNYGRGGWHIDHIKPLASFDINEENWIQEAFSLDNLQPLFESENCSKGSLYEGKRYFRNGQNGSSTKK